MNNLPTIYAKKDYVCHTNCITTLYNESMKVIKIITGYNQPNKSRKTIEFKGSLYNLKFI